MNKKYGTVFLLLVAIFTGCQSAQNNISEATKPASPVQATEMPTSLPLPTETTGTNAAESEGIDRFELSDADIGNLLYELSNANTGEGLEMLEIIGASGDRTFIPVLIEIFRAGQLAIVPWGIRPELIATLETLSGQSFGNNWQDWIEWYGTTDIIPPAEFTSWKGHLLSNIDPRFSTFFQDEFSSRIRVEEIVWGGVVLDGIPALDHAKQIPANEGDYLDPDDPVFGISIHGDSRAYPLRIIDWHEMANDTIGGVPVSIAYCTLCGAAVAYDGRATNGETYDFGSSGFLFRSNKLMYDRQTKTLWNQLSGEPVLGSLVDQGVTLKILPIVLTTWEDWKTQHPDTTVLSLDTGFSRDYSLGAAYGEYFAAADTMFPVWQRSDLLPTKSQIYALRINGFPKAYPLERLVEEKVSNDTLGGIDLVLVTSGDIIASTGVSRRVGTVQYNTGAQVRAYERGDHTFSSDDAAMGVVDETGAVWQVTEDALIGPNGEELSRLGGHLAYWFGWYAFFPQTAIYGDG
jgi:hypothetical protein